METGGRRLFSLCVCVCVKEVAYIFLTDVESRQNVVVSGAAGTPTCLLDGSHSVPPQIHSNSFSSHNDGGLIN